MDLEFSFSGWVVMSVRLHHGVAGLLRLDEVIIAFACILKCDNFSHISKGFVNKTLTFKDRLVNHSLLGVPLPTRYV